MNANSNTASVKAAIEGGYFLASASGPSLACVNSTAPSNGLLMSSPYGRQGWSCNDCLHLLGSDGEFDDHTTKQLFSADNGTGDLNDSGSKVSHRSPSSRTDNIIRSPPMSSIPSSSLLLASASFDRGHSTESLLSQLAPSWSHSMFERVFAEKLSAVNFKIAPHSNTKTVGGVRVSNNIASGRRGIIFGNQRGKQVHIQHLLKRAYHLSSHRIAKVMLCFCNFSHMRLKR
jgi:hypothetical protein